MVYLIYICSIIGFINLIINGDADIILSCGIFGIITTKPTKLNKTVFNVLGIENDTRGGDSCGIFIDGDVEYGINDKKLYSKFFLDSKLLNSTNKCCIALGHCRKASVGNISLATAQPVVLTDDNGNVEFVVIHNGTISNYKELAEKYIPEIDINGLTDSQVMARIFYYKGYDVLQDYYGGAVFVIVDYRKEKPKVYLWKGNSKQYKYSNIAYDERPFYFINDGNRFIFSSLRTYLNVFSTQEVFTLNPNLLIELKDGKLYTYKEFDRSDNYQSGYTPTTNVIASYSNYYGYYTEHNKESTGKIGVSEEGLYGMGDSNCHGVYNVDCNGNTYKTESAGKTEKLYFWDGILLYGASAFNFLKNACNKWSLQTTDVKYVMGELLNYLSPYPISDAEYAIVNTPYINQKCFKSNGDRFIPYSGSVKRFLKANVEHYTDGTRIGTSWTSTKEENFNELKKTLKETNINYGELYRELYS